MKQFLSVHDVQDLPGLVALAARLKANPWQAEDLGRRRTLGLVFLNPSLRTRLSTQKAARLLGMDVMVMNLDKDGWQLELAPGAIMNGDKAEHIQDAAAVMGQYCDIIGVRAFPGLKDRAADYGEAFINAFNRYCNVPLLSLESATLHPLQSLADLLTLHETWQKPHKPKIALTWAPHPRVLPQAVSNSFAQWVLAAGYHLTIAHPKGYELDTAYTAGAQITHNQDEAVADADYVYVKNWSTLEPYGTNPSGNDSSWLLMPDRLKPEAHVMHCLPVRRGVELSHELLDSPASLVQQQAGNRVWAAQAVLYQLLKGL